MLKLHLFTYLFLHELRYEVVRMWKEAADVWL